MKNNFALHSIDSKVWRNAEAGGEAHSVIIENDSFHAASPTAILLFLTAHSNNKISAILNMFYGW